MKPLYQKLASLVQARLNCLESRNVEWFDKHEAEIERLVKEHLPSGGGFDNGTQIDFDKSTANKLVFNTAFHHMNESGMYDGWTDHAVFVTADLAFGFDLKVSGRNRNDIKEYIAEAFDTSLRTDIEQELKARWSEA